MKTMLDSFQKGEDRPWGSFLVYSQNEPLSAEWLRQFFKEVSSRYPQADKRGSLTACRDQWINEAGTGMNLTVKLVAVAKSSRLSLQLHTKRSEHWFCLAGRAYALIGHAGHVVELGPGDSAYVPQRALHRLSSKDEGAVILEIAEGDFNESDIVRLQDDYSRVAPRIQSTTSD